MKGDARLLRAFAPKPFTVVAANNATLTTEDGRELVDLGGASQGVAVVGHNHPRVVAAIQAQAGRLVHVAQTVPNDARGDFLDRLHALLPASMEQTFIANSGTEAVECAIKLAVATTGRQGLTACVGSFHGRTTSSLALTHRPAFRQPFAGILPAAAHVPFGDVEGLSAITNETAAFIVEPVQGEGGVRVAPPGFLQAARERCDEVGAMLVFDEIQSGMGRTGTFLASAQASVVPDAVLLGKGLAGGLPIGTCSITDRLQIPSGGHGSTYGGAPLVCHAGTAALDVLADEKLMQRAIDLRLPSRLAKIGHPLLRDVGGAGMMVSAVLRQRPGEVLGLLQDAGFLALSAGTTEVRFLPPLTIPETQLDAALTAFAAALGAP